MIDLFAFRSAIASQLTGNIKLEIRIANDSDIQIFCFDDKDQKYSCFWTLYELNNQQMSIEDLGESEGKRIQKIFERE